MQPGLRYAIVLPHRVVFVLGALIEHQFKLALWSVTKNLQAMNIEIKLNTFDRLKNLHNSVFVVGKCFHMNCMNTCVVLSYK